MDKNVILSIRGQQTVDGEEPEVTELVTEGILSWEGDFGCTLSYQESELTGLEDTMTTFRIEAGRVSLLRVGQVNSEMVFEEGRLHLSMYDTPYGSLAIGVNTNRMKVCLDENGGEIEISYAIEIDHAVASQNLFRIRVRERDVRVPSPSNSGRGDIPCHQPSSKVCERDEHDTSSEGAGGRPDSSRL